MDVSLSRSRRPRSGHYASQIISVLIALTAGSGMLHATNLLTTSVTSVSLTCNTATGPGASATITVKPVTALTLANTIVVSASAVTGTGNAGVVVTAPGSQTLNAANSAAGIIYTVSMTTGCVGAATAAPVFHFNAGATADAAITVNTTLTATTSGLAAAPSALTFTCTKNGSTYYPGAAQTVSITSAATGGTPFTVDTVTNAPAAWLTVNPTTGGTANGSAIQFTATLAAGCGSFSTGTTNTTTIHLLNAPAPDKVINVTLQVVAPSNSPLVATPSPVTITCAKSAGGSYFPSTAQTVSVTSAAQGGTAFTVDTVTNAPAAWLVVTPTTGGTATTSPVTFTLAAAAGCGGFAQSSSNTTAIHLLNAPALDKVILVTLQIVPTTILTATPNPATLTYVKGSGTAGKVDVNITASVSPAPFFSVNTATLPIWLTVDSTNGIAPKSLRFSSTSVGDTLAPGTYSATVLIGVSGYGDLSVPISLLVTNKAPRLSVAEGTTRNISWTIGQALPTPTITAVSTDTPISYTVTTGGTLAPVVPASQQNGLAYSFGSPINVSFNNLVFAAAQPGNVLTGTVTLTWGSPASTIVVTFNVTVLSPGATANGISPATLPTASPGSVFTVVLTGTGFVPSTDSSQKTKVGVVIGGTLVADTNISGNIINPSNIILTITVPAVADANLPFSPTGVGGSVTIGVCNPVAGACSIPTGTATLAIGSNPIIQAVTSSSSLLQVTPPALQTLAPYDMVSIFGANFCSSNNTGCSSNQVLSGTPDATTLTYPTTLSPDSAGATQRSLSVTFQTHPGAVLLGTAPLLFATNGQINLMVPGAVSAQIGNSVDIVVNFGYGSGATLLSSAPFTVNIVATNPGIFTVGADGQGDGAALDSKYNLLSNANPGGMRSTATDSDTIQIYMTGLGVPDSAADNANAGAGYSWSADCVSTTSYLASFNTQTGNSLGYLDGTLIIPSVLNSNRLVPCVATSSADVPTVTVGGVAGTVTYGGWVAGTIAGLYQLNVTLPGTAAGPFTNAAGQAVNAITAPVQLPVVVTANSRTSQSGVNVWVTPRLKLAPPSGAGLTGTVGTPWGNSNNVVIATEGTSPYRYAVTSGLLPAGLSLNATTGAISGTPAANTAGSYVVTVTGTDSANVPVKGTTTFTLSIAGGLFMTSSGTAPYNATFGSANASLTTVIATSGVYPYSFSIATASTLPTGLTIGASSGIVSTTAATPAGTYHVTVTATDSTSGTPLTGTISYDIVVALHVVRSNPVTLANGNAGTISTVSATGNTGTVTYALDATTAALSWVSLDVDTGVLTVTNGSVAGVRSVTITATDGTAPSNATAAGTGLVTFNMTIN